MSEFDRWMANLIIQGYADDSPPTGKSTLHRWTVAAEVAKLGRSTPG
jgi:hypothetical protein